ncbi:hypothetical protein GCM10009416_47660 [Craurococcus roseus]|uniref:Glycosyltransferase n=1 Tax=Craurococcus roseus TaxID=77585 RepID=A0ABP3R874_9PROT
MRRTKAEAAPGKPGAAAFPGAAVGLQPVEHRLVRLPSGVVLLELNCAVPAEGAGGAALLVDGAPLPPPSALLSLSRPGAPSRAILAVRDSAELLRPGAACVLTLGGAPAAAFPLDPPVPAETLTLDREAGDHERLLRFLVGTCAQALRAADDPDLAALCHSLARAAAGEGAGGDAVPLSHPGARLSAWAVPLAGGGSGAWRLLSRGAVRRIAPPEGGVLLLDKPPVAGAVLLPPAPAAPLAFQTAVRGAASLPGLATLAREALRPDGSGPGAAAGRRVLPALLRRARTDARCAALLREAQLMEPARPQRLNDPAKPVGGALELAVSDHGGGLFLCGWLRDPLALVDGLELRGPGGEAQPIPPAALHRVARPDLAERFARAAFGGAGLAPGFLAHLPAADHPGVAQWRLGVRLLSGASLDLSAPPGLLPPETARDLVLRSAHPDALRPGLLDACIAPAAERLHAAVMRGWTGEPDAVEFGAAQGRAPRVSVVVPLYRTLRFLRFQIAAFARDPGVRGAADLVFVLDSPEQRHEVEPLLRGLSALHGGLGLRLAVMPGNRGYAAACNAGAALARADTLLFLNSDVLPAAPGWLPPLLEPLRRDRALAAIGPKLLFEDGSVQHAGMVFRQDAAGEWLNDHRCKGFPRSHPDAARGGPVPAVTGAALCVRRAAFEAAGGFDTGYVIGDFEDSDLCLKLRAAGGEIAYEPASELFHFERQSVSAHEGHSRTLAGAYNRRRHHRRWDAAMAALMARFPEGA